MLVWAISYLFMFSARLRLSAVCNKNSPHQRFIGRQQIKLLFKVSPFVRQHEATTNSRFSNADNGTPSTINIFILAEHEARQSWKSSSKTKSEQSFFLNCIKFQSAFVSREAGGNDSFNAILTIIVPYQAPRWQSSRLFLYRSRLFFHLEVCLKLQIRFATVIKRIRSETKLKRNFWFAKEISRIQLAIKRQTELTS